MSDVPVIVGRLMGESLYSNEFRLYIYMYDFFKRCTKTLNSI